MKSANMIKSFVITSCNVISDTPMIVTFLFAEIYRWRTKLKGRFSIHSITQMGINYWLKWN